MILQSDKQKKTQAKRLHSTGVGKLGRSKLDNDHDRSTR